jgi:hypothetical protein
MQYHLWMRTTLDIDDDVLIAAKELAAVQNSSAGKVISELARRSLTQGTDGPLVHRNGFWVLPKRGGVVTSELVNRLADAES